MCDLITSSTYINILNERSIRWQTLLSELKHQMMALDIGEC
nr:MAG TPA: hypothetical protein [Caudoviricetes sp.]